MSITLPRMPPPDGMRVLRREPIADGPAGGRLILLVHGTMDRATSFTRLMARLPDWTILTYDRRGYADSLAMGPPRDFRVQVDDLLGVLDGRADFAFGHSYGGDVVLAAAEVAPEMLPAIMCWEPPLPWKPWWPEDSIAGGFGSEMEPGERAEWFMRRMISDRVWDRLPARTKEMRRAEGPTFAAEIASLANPVFDPEHIHIPVTLGRGGQTSQRQRRGVRELQQELPNAVMVEVPESDHGVHLSHPNELAELIRQAAANG